LELLAFLERDSLPQDFDLRVVGVFPDNSHDPIVYPVTATVNAKPGTIQYLAFLRSAQAKSIFEGYGFSVPAKPTS
jgi:molybdate transport system substrate-binding protein